MTNNNLAKTTVRRIFSLLIPRWELLANEDIDKAIDVIESVWSDISDSLLEKTFEEVKEDLIQHYVRNNDYETGYLFEEVLKVYSLGYSSIKLFIESVLDPKNFNDLDSLQAFSSSLDYELMKEGFRLVILDYDELEFPIQVVDEVENVQDLPQNVKVNDIPFYVYKNSVIKAKEQEYFILDPNKRWNDYSVVSVFNLVYYYDYGKKKIDMGNLRIIHIDKLTTWEILPDKFLRLSNDFCSLGYSDNFYEDFLRVFKIDNTISLLFALQDVAYFSDIQEKFENTYNFNKSLIRFDNSERYLREVRPLLNGANMDNFYSFAYNFKPTIVHRK